MANEGWRPLGELPIPEPRKPLKFEGLTARGGRVVRCRRTTRPLPIRRVDGEQQARVDFADGNGSAWITAWRPLPRS